MTNLLSADFVRDLSLTNRIVTATSAQGVGYRCTPWLCSDAQVDPERGYLHDPGSVPVRDA